MFFVQRFVNYLQGKSIIEYYQNAGQVYRRVIVNGN